MSIFSQINSIFDLPSRRSDIDYTRKVSWQVVTGIFLLLRRMGKSMHIDTWLNEVGEDFMDADHDFIPYWGHYLSDSGSSPLNVFIEYFKSRQPKSIAFLDFLVLAFRNKEAPLDNDIILAINRVLKEQECPYRLSEFMLKDDGTVPVSDTIIHRPFVYLVHDSAAQIHAIAPALALFHSEDLVAPANAFLKALKRHGDADYEGCITSCSAAVESAIKVVAVRREWPIKGNGIGVLTKKFVKAAEFPDKYSQVASILAERRQNAGDAHGHEGICKATEAETRFLIGLCASFIVYIASALGEKTESV